MRKENFSVREFIPIALEEELKRVQKGQFPLSCYGVGREAVFSRLKELRRIWSLCGSCDNCSPRVFSNGSRYMVEINCDLGLTPKDNGIGNPLTCPNYVLLNSLDAYKGE